MLYQDIVQSIKQLQTASIDAERMAVLNDLIAYIQNKQASHQTALLNFICTHNSRRSHLAQIWAQTLAAYHGVPNVLCFSGGTEATALFEEVAETLQKQGFEFVKLSPGNNPIFAIKFSESHPCIIGFSKSYEHALNPSSGFAAVMTCAQADEACPYIPGAEKRIALRYEDPKAFDKSPLRSEKYLDRSIQIATELNYVFSKIKQHVK